MMRFQLLSAPELLLEASSLFGAHGVEDWSRNFQAWAAQFRGDPDGTARTIMSSARGWSDVTLHQNGVPLKEENERLRAILDELHRLLVGALNPATNRGAQ